MRSPHSHVCRSSHGVATTIEVRSENAGIGSFRGHHDKSENAGVGAGLFGRGLGGILLRAPRPLAIANANKACILNITTLKFRGHTLLSIDSPGDVPPFVHMIHFAAILGLRYLSLSGLNEKAVCTHPRLPCSKGAHTIFRGHISRHKESEDTQ